MLGTRGPERSLPSHQNSVQQERREVDGLGEGRADRKDVNEVRLE